MDNDQIDGLLELAADFQRAVLHTKWAQIPDDSDSYKRLVIASEVGDPRLRKIATDLANAVYSMQFP